MSLVESGQFDLVSEAVPFEAEVLRCDALPAGEWTDWTEGDLLAEYRTRCRSERCERMT